MSPEEYTTELILNLGEVETLELLRVLGDTGDAPPFGRGEFSPSEVRDWVVRNQELVIPSILRVVDLGNEAVAYLHRLGVFPIGELRREGNLIIRFPEFSSKASDASNAQAFSLADLAATSAALCEMAFEVEAANHAFGITSDAPTVSIQAGSIQYAVGGSLLASGVGLVVACGTGLVAGPLGFIGGGIMASAGIIDLALGWRKAATESTKLRSEAHKLDAEALKLRAEARKLEVESRKLELEAKDMQDRIHNEPIHQYRNSAYSKLVPREVVLREAEALGLKEGYANHLLNRSLAKYISVLQRFQHIAGDNSHSASIRKLIYLVEQGVEDPDVELWLGLLRNDHTSIKRALERGADPNVLLNTVMARHHDILKG